MSTDTIASGGTFWALAQRYGCTVEAIMSVNPCLVLEQLQIGQVIRLPRKDQGSSFIVNQGPLGPTENPSPNARLDTTLNVRVPGRCEYQC
jgi:LysM repeat protein